MGPRVNLGTGDREPAEPRAHPAHLKTRRSSIDFAKRGEEWRRKSRLAREADQMDLVTQAASHAEFEMARAEVVRNDLLEQLEMAEQSLAEMEALQELLARLEADASTDGAQAGLDARGWLEQTRRILVEIRASLDRNTESS